ncbi:hypothetical protein D3C84_1275240 [compost metagenome]
MRLLPGFNVRSFVLSNQWLQATCKAAPRNGTSAAGSKANCPLTRAMAHALSCPTLASRKLATAFTTAGCAGG